MSIRHPFGETDIQTIYAAGGTLEIPISCGTTILETQTLTSNCTINLDVDSDIQLGAEILIKCTTNGTETFTFGTGIDAPTITGVAGKTWSQSFIYNGSNFVPEGVHSFTESLCPSITLLDLDWSSSLNPYFIVGVYDSVSLGAFFTESISAGTPPASLSITSGSIPAGTTFSYRANRQVWWIEGTPDPGTFGSYTFTIGGTDANGCAITPRSYTIEVWLMKEVTPGVIAGGGVTSFTVTVSGIAGVFGTAATLAKIDFDITYVDIADIGCYIDSPDTSPTGCLFPQSWDSEGMNITGTPITGCIINNSSLGTFPNTATGSAPYTGNWNDLVQGETTPYYDTNFTGDTMNGTWAARFETIGVDGAVNYIKFYFKPL